MARCSKRLPNGGPKGVQNALKTMVPRKTSEMWFRTLFATFQPYPPCLKTLALGTLLGHLGGGPREVNERTSPKHTSQGAHGHLGGPRDDFGVPRGVPIWRQYPSKLGLGRHALSLGVPRWSRDGHQRPQGPRTDLKQCLKSALFYAYCSHSAFCAVIRCYSATPMFSAGLA